MKKQLITTAETAAQRIPVTRRGFSSAQMLNAIGNIRRDNTELAHYLTHSEIITGLSKGRFGPNGLKRRLTEMLAADSD